MAVELVPWTSGDLPLLHALLGDPALTAHLGGPETPAQIAARHERYVRLPETGHAWMYKIVCDGAAAGSVGFWEKVWRDEPVYETGWSVLPAFQGRGVATAATLLVIAAARERRERTALHAFPSVANAPSNAICRKVGFTLLGPCDFEYPPGHLLRVNDWRLELGASGAVTVRRA